MSLIWERGHLQMAMLDVKDLNVYYGKIHAIKNISLTVEEGELVSLIGANGAGKTSLLTAIMGQIPSTGQFPQISRISQIYFVFLHSKTLR